MAKIRTLKGEFFRNADVSRAGPTAKLLAAGLVCTVADDEGRFKASADYIRGEVFTHDDLTVVDVEAALFALADDSVDFVRLYTLNQRHFGYIPGWKEHQRVPPTRFVKSKLPAPPYSIRRRQGAGNPQTSDIEAQAGASSRAGVGKERKGEEGKGKEGRGVISTTSHSANGGELLVLEPEISVSQFDQVWQAWLVSRAAFAAEQGRRPGSVRLDDLRRRRINNALKTYPLEDVIDAVEGWRFSPHHSGENDRNAVYNDIELLLRDAKHIEEFRDYKRRGHVVALPGKRTLAQSYREQAAALKEAGD